MHTTSYLKKRILVQDQGGFGFQTGVILKYVEDLKLGSNAEIGPKDFFEVACTETGSVLVITMLVMVSLTALGLMSIYTGIIEMHIGQNERQLQETFYSAEGCAVETIQVLSSMPSIDFQLKNAEWLHSLEKVKTEKIDFRNPSHWNIDTTGEVNAASSKIFADTYFSVVEWDVAGGGSLVLGNRSRLHQMRIYSLCTLYDVNELIEIGYLQRY